MFRVEEAAIGLRKGGNNSSASASSVDLEQARKERDENIKISGWF